MTIRIDVVHHFPAFVGGPCSCCSTLEKAIAKSEKTISSIIMTSNARLREALADLNDTLTKEIKQIEDKLAAAGVDDENLQLVRDLKNRVAGIVSDVTPAPETTGGGADAGAEGDKTASEESASSDEEAP